MLRGCVRQWVKNIEEINNVSFKNMFLQILRKRRGMSQDFLAQKLGMTRPTFAQIESGKREMTISEVQKCAKIFGLSLDDFLAERDTPAPEVNLEKSKVLETENTVRISVPQKNLNKFREVLLYILEQIGARSNVGEAVICKLLYFIDFDFYEKYETQLIGAEYLRNHHGPTPAAFPEIIKQMEADGDLVPVVKKYFQYDQKKYLPRCRPNLEKAKLSAREKEHIDWEIARFGNKTAKEMEDISHRDTPWVVTEPLQIINYESVFYRSDEFSVRDYDSL